MVTAPIVQRQVIPRSFVLGQDRELIGRSASLSIISTHVVQQRECLPVQHALPPGRSCRIWGRTVPGIAYRSRSPLCRMRDGDPTKERRLLASYDLARVLHEQHQMHGVGGRRFEVMVQVEVACGVVQSVDQQRPHPDDLGRLNGPGDRIT
jgi:hypothetical protein